MQAFYVYEHHRGDGGGVFYVGKGKGDRARAAGSQRSSYWHRVKEKSGGFSVRFVASGLDEELAFLVECERIDQLRRVGVQLCNLTDGGDGTAGHKRSESWCAQMSKVHKGKIVSEETRKKLSISVKKFGFVFTDQMRAKISATHLGKQRTLGLKHSEETKRKMSESHRGNKSRSGQTISDAERAKISEALKGRPQRFHVCPHCGKQGGNTMHRWHFDNCKENQH